MNGKASQPATQHWPPSVPDWVFAPIFSGLLLLIVGLFGLAAHRMWLFASLGPTAYEFAEKPELPGSHVYNAIVGHLIGLGCGFVSVWLLGVWNAPPVVASRMLTSERVWASVLAVGLTSMVALFLRAFHPSAAATTLLLHWVRCQLGPTQNLS